MQADEDGPCVLTARPSKQDDRTSKEKREQIVIQRCRKNVGVNRK